jgi:ABC-type dipeptide/oligopeptide/nickel transport system permease component
MGKYIVNRLGQAVFTLLLVSLIIFFAVRLSGSPVDVYVALDASEETRQNFIRQMGLDKPLYQQYIIFLGNALRGDLGRSFANKKLVTHLIADRIFNTLKLAGFTMTVSFLFGFVLGISSAVLRKTRFNKIFLAFFALGQSTPVFFVLMLSIALFGVKLGWLPIIGMKDGIKSYIMPGGLLGLILSTVIAFVLRNSLIDSFSSSYIMLARLKGLPEYKVVLKHALKNTITPIIGLTSVMLSRQLMGTLIVETMFAWPGLGLLSYQSIVYRDYVTIQGLVIVMTIFVIFVNFLADVTYAVIDPRIRKRS